jgi:aminopeptidase S
MRMPAAALAAILAMLLTGCGSPSLEATPTPDGGVLPTPSSAADSNGPAAPSFSEPVTPKPMLDAPALVDSVSLTSIEAHLAAFQAIADANGGQRGSGSPGYLASVRHVTDALLAGGYAPELEVLREGGRELTNVIAERSGTAPGRVVVIGAHLDSVAVGPGINDNASGVAVSLAIAAALSEQPSHPVTVRFAFWDAEEGGPFGSAAHVGGLSAEEADRIEAYLNLDMVGSPNPVRFVYDETTAATGSAALTDAFAAAFDAEGLAWDPIDLGGDSDHGPFAAAGIPTGGVFTGGIEDVTPDQAARHGATAGVPSDACSHRACDTLENVDAEVAAGMARIVAVVLVQLAAR